VAIIAAGEKADMPLGIKDLGVRLLVDRTLG
jgi:hypothetical protein